MKAQKPRGREKILSLRIASIFIFVTLLIPTHLARAVPITIEITGEVTSIGGTGVPDTIQVGDMFSGTYTYDSSTIDSEPINEVGQYWHDGPYGINVSLGGYEFMTAPGHIGQFLISLRLPPYGNRDYYIIKSYQNTTLPTEIAVEEISWILGDSTQSALDSVDLPITAPELSLWDYNVFEIIGEGSSFEIKGVVTQSVPEPSTVFLMMIGILLFKCKR